MEKVKSALGIIFTIVVYAVVGIACGILSVELGLASITWTNTKMDPVLGLVVMLLMLYGSIFLHIIIHEGGHFIFGKISGYRLSSFRIGSFMFIRKNNKIELKKYKLLGTGGQCLSPPQCKDSSYRFSYVLYNIGGIITNAISGLIAIVLFVLLGDKGIFPVFLCIFAITGFSMAILNGVPMKAAGVANDGHNAISLGKNDEGRRAFWLQLVINENLTEGQRLKDMPQEWFELPEDADMTNPIVCACAVLKGSRYHDQMEFKKAQELYINLLENAPGLLGLYKNELRCALMFYEIIGEGRIEEIDKLYTKKLKSYIKATSLYVTRQRLMYAYELLIKKDQLKAGQRLEAFEKACRTYPYASEIENEREIIEYIQHMVREE
jgi:hypothetical protein